MPKRYSYRRGSSNYATMGKLSKAVADNFIEKTSADKPFTWHRNKTIEQRRANILYHQYPDMFKKQQKKTFYIKDSSALKDSWDYANNFRDDLARNLTAQHAFFQPEAMPGEAAEAFASRLAQGAIQGKMDATFIRKAFYGGDIDIAMDPDVEATFNNAALEVRLKQMWRKMYSQASEAIVTASTTSPGCTVKTAFPLQTNNGELWKAAPTFESLDAGTGKVDDPPWRPFVLEVKSFSVQDIIACADGMLESYIWHEHQGYSLVTDDVRVVVRPVEMQTLSSQVDSTRFLGNDIQLNGEPIARQQYLGIQAGHFNRKMPTLVFVDYDEQKLIQHGLLQDQVNVNEDQGGIRSMEIMDLATTEIPNGAQQWSTRQIWASDCVSFLMPTFQDIRISDAELAAKKGFRYEKDGAVYNMVDEARFRGPDPLTDITRGQKLALLQNFLESQNRHYQMNNPKRIIKHAQFIKRIYMVYPTQLTNAPNPADRATDYRKTLAPKLVMKVQCRPLFRRITYVTPVKTISQSAFNYYLKSRFIGQVVDRGDQIQRVRTTAQQVVQSVIQTQLSSRKFGNAVDAFTANDINSMGNLLRQKGQGFRLASSTRQLQHYLNTGMYKSYYDFTIKMPYGVVSLRAAEMVSSYFMNVEQNINQYVTLVKAFKEIAKAGDWNSLTTFPIDKRVTALGTHDASVLKVAFPQIVDKVKRQAIKTKTVSTEANLKKFVPFLYSNQTIGNSGGSYYLETKWVEGVIPKPKDEEVRTHVMWQATVVSKFIKSLRMSGNHGSSLFLVDQLMRSLVAKNPIIDAFSPLVTNVAAPTVNASEIKGMFQGYEIGSDKIVAVAEANRYDNGAVGRITDGVLESFTNQHINVIYSSYLLKTVVTIVHDTKPIEAFAKYVSQRDAKPAAFSGVPKSGYYQMAGIKLSNGSFTGLFAGEYYAKSNAQQSFHKLFTILLAQLFLSVADCYYGRNYHGVNDWKVYGFLRQLQSYCSEVSTLHGNNAPEVLKEIASIDILYPRIKPKAEGGNDKFNSIMQQHAKIGEKAYSRFAGDENRLTVATAAARRAQTGEAYAVRDI